MCIRDRHPGAALIFHPGEIIMVPSDQTAVSDKENLDYSLISGTGQADHISCLLYTSRCV